MFPAERYPAYSPIHILNYWQDHLDRPLQTDQKVQPVRKPPLLILSFSAGVVGAFGAALAWRGMGGEVKALIALDGWGVPLYADFPIHRVSHDYFTHWSSALLGTGEDSFYAEPPVAHLELWRSPQSAQGWWVPSTVSNAQVGRSSQTSVPVQTTAAVFLLTLLTRYS